MIFSKKKQEVDLDTFCSDFYEKYILNPVIEGVDASVVLVDNVKRTIAEADTNFANIKSQKLATEIVILRFELFALAWLHQFGDKSAVAQSVFTKRYLHKKKRNDIWKDSESYNQTIARSSTFGKKPENALDRVYLARINTTRLDLSKQFHNEGYDIKCVVRVMNRLFAEEAWEKGLTAGLLMFALCDRLGFESNFEPTKEAQNRLIAIIRGFYDGARQSLKKIKVA